MDFRLLGFKIYFRLLCLLIISCSGFPFRKKMNINFVINEHKMKEKKLFSNFLAYVHLPKVKTFSDLKFPVS